MKPLPRVKNERNALNAAHVKLGRPNTTACVVKTRSETVWSALLDNTPRGGGTVEVGIDTFLLHRGGVVASRQCMQRHLIRSLQVDRLWKTGSVTHCRIGSMRFTQDVDLSIIGPFFTC